jgi:hypothetical protein
VILVYVAGPYSAPDEAGILANVNAAIDAGNRLRNAGCAVIIPHTSHYSHQRQPRSYEAWMREDFELLLRSDCLFRLPGASPGAEREVACAQACGMPVFDVESELLEWADAMSR